MFCTQCGIEIKDKAKFCHNCGADVAMVEYDEMPRKKIANKTKSKTPNETLYFYSVPVNKFIFLSVITFGLYDIFWFAKNFTLIKDQEKSKIWPVARGFFAIFFYSELARKVLKSAKVNGYTESYDPTILAIFYFIAAVLGRAPDPWWLLSFGSVLLLMPTVKAIRYNNEKIEAPVNTKYELGEILVIIVGILFWSFAILGLLSEYLYS